METTLTQAEVLVEFLYCCKTQLLSDRHLLSISLSDLGVLCFVLCVLCTPFLAGKPGVELTGQEITDP